MINFSHIFSCGTVFVSCAENIEEEKQLNTLVHEVLAICKMTKSTGLWIVAEFHVGLIKVVAMSLKEKVELHEHDIPTLQAEVQAVIALRMEVIKHLQRRLQCLKN